jgi:hypothetical protein
MEPWQEEGTIGFFLPEAEPGWRTDRRRHDLPPLRVNRFRVTLSKSEDRLLSVEIHNLLELPVLLQTPLPAGTEPMHVTILWRAGHAQLYLDGAPTAITAFPDIEEARHRADN